MIYLNTKDIEKLGIDWNEAVQTIEDGVKCLEAQDYAQPIKPYLRYRDPQNRIIAMPAFIGGAFSMAGIKWIASFPGNIEKNIPRAHCVVVLNNSETGQPISIINSPMISIIRTAAVSGLMLKYYDRARKPENLKLAICGWGPIGQHHFKMCMDILGEKISKVLLYDIRPIPQNSPVLKPYKDKVEIKDSWEAAYTDADIFITCTVSKEAYIDKKPKPGSLQLNVSLRDYKTDIYDYVKNTIVVDDWEEVCRENTDIEKMHKEKDLKKDDTRNIKDVVCRGFIESCRAEDAIMFNPMGMGVFDIAIGSYYYKRALDSNIGQELE